MASPMLMVITFYCAAAERRRAGFHPSMPRSHSAPAIDPRLPTTIAEMNLSVNCLPVTPLYSLADSLARHGTTSDGPAASVHGVVGQLGWFLLFLGCRHLGCIFTRESEAVSNFQ